MVYKYTSAKRVLAKIFTDLDLKEDTHKISDMIEWMGEALEKIGAFPQFIHRVAGKNDLPLLEISNYQARLPFDFHQLVQLAYAPAENGPYYDMRSATGSFDREINDPTVSSTDVDEVASTNSLVTLAMSLYDMTYVQALNKINTEPATRSLLSGLLTSANTTTPGGALSNTEDYTYVITDNWIKCNVETGYLMLAYQAIPTDAEGYPLVPDSQSFLDALYWYVTMKLLYPKWAAGQIRDAVYYDARRSWNYYCKQAYGDAMMPDPDQMESVKNSWLRLIPNLDQHGEFYSTVGERELVWNHNRT